MGGGVLGHLVVQTDFEFKISGPLVIGNRFKNRWWHRDVLVSVRGRTGSNDDH